MHIPVGYAQVNFIYTGPGVPTGAEWTLGLDISEYGSGPDIAAADVIAAYTSADFDSNTAVGVNLTGVLVKYGPNETGPAALVAASVAGSSTGTQSNPNTAALVRKNTASGGRSGRGRLYFPGVAESDVAQGGALEPGYVSAMQTKFATFGNSLTAEGLTPVLLHSAAAGIPITTPLEITSFSVDSKAATQRRRLRR